MDGTPGQPTSLGTRRHGIPGTVLSTRQSIGARILGTMVVGTHRGTTTLGIMDIPGDGAIRGITADGTTLGTGILGTIADGTVENIWRNQAGTIRGITEAGATAIITTTTVISSVLAADGFTLHVLAQPAQAEEAESGPLQGAPE